MGVVTGELVVVATPIGNLGDLSERARAVLADARRRLLRGHAAHARPPVGDRHRRAGRLVSLHAHNEASKATWVVERVAAGARVAYVTDAGTPGVSDPGDRLIAAVAAAGLRVTVVPGPSAALAALVVSGLPTERFCVDGFLPRKGAEREARLAVLKPTRRAPPCCSSRPPRLAATLGDLAAALGERTAAVCRELTKRHEEVRRGTLGELAVVVRGRAGAQGRGRHRVGGARPARRSTISTWSRRSPRARRGVDDRETPRVAVAATLGVSRRRAYEVALRHQPERKGVAPVRCRRAPLLPDHADLLRHGPAAPRHGVLHGQRGRARALAPAGGRRDQVPHRHRRARRRRSPRPPRRTG